MDGRFRLALFANQKSTQPLPSPTLNPPPVSGPILENGSAVDRRPPRLQNGESAGSYSINSIQTDGVRTPTTASEYTPKTPRKSSISFAPLPQAQRQRRNSITLGVAARSQILRSQGGGRSSAGAGPPRPRGPKTVHVYEGGQDWSKRDQVVDLGELGKKLWKKWREGKRGGQSMTTEEAAAKEKAEAEEEAVRQETLTAVPHPTPRSPPPELEDEEEDGTPKRPFPRRRSGSPTPPPHGSTRDRDVLGFDYAEIEPELDEPDEAVNEDVLEEEEEEEEADEEETEEDADAAEEKESLPSASSES